MADFTNLLRSDAIISPLAAESRQQIIRQMSDRLAEITGLDARDILEAVMERERLGSTGVGEGVAIPHARIPGVDKAVGAFALLETPCDFEAMDDHQCDLVFMLLAPEGAGADHLRALAHVSREFRQPALRAALRSAADEAAIRDLLLGDSKGAAA